MAQPNPLSALKAQPAAPRLEGDDLYAWASLIAAVRHAQNDLGVFGRMSLERLGYDPGRYVLTNDGYIKERSEVEPESA